MLFYITNLLTICIYALLLNSVFDKETAKKYFFFFVFLHLVILMGGRAVSVGTDNALYSRIFYRIGISPLKINFTEDNTFIISMLNKIVFMTTNGNYQVYLFVISSLTMLGIIHFINSYSKVYAFSSIYYFITLYFYLNSFNISRQMFAVSIGINAALLLKNKKYFLGISLILISTLIHNTSMFLLILIPLSQINWNKKKYIILATTTLCFFLLVPLVINIFVNVFSHYSLYTNDVNSTIDVVSSGKKIFLSAFYLIILILGISTIKDKPQIEEKKFESEYKMLTSIMIVAVIIGLIFYKDILIGRIETYFSIFIIVYLPMTIQRVSLKFERSKLIEAFFFYGSYIATFIVLIVQLRSNLSGVVPYIFLK